VSRQTAWKWRRRPALQGLAGLDDRSRRATGRRSGSAAACCGASSPLRLRLRVGPHWIAWLTGAARSSAHAVLRRLGLSRLRVLAPREPEAGASRRGRRLALHRPHRQGAPPRQWLELRDVAVDDAARPAYAEELPDERGDRGRVP